MVDFIKLGFRIFSATSHGKLYLLISFQEYYALYHINRKLTLEPKVNS